jgi:hypothetical protein
MVFPPSVSKLLGEKISFLHSFGSQSPNKEKEVRREVGARRSISFDVQNSKH